MWRVWLACVAGGFHGISNPNLNTLIRTQAWTLSTWLMMVVMDITLVLTVKILA